MNFKKVKELVDNKNIVLDIDHADEHELRVNYKPGDYNCWIDFTPEKYKSEGDLATVINTEVERILYGRIKTDLG